MTRDEILALEGRDLDRAVAEIMGTSAPDVLVKIQGGPTVTVTVPSYGTDIRCALMLAEKFQLTITPKLDATDKSRWLADQRNPGSGGVWLAFGPTAAIAICRAALMLTNDPSLSVCGGCGKPSGNLRRVCASCQVDYDLRAVRIRKAEKEYDAAVGECVKAGLLDRADQRQPIIVDAPKEPS